MRFHTTFSRLCGHLVRYLLTIGLLLPAQTSLAAPRTRQPNSAEQPKAVKSICQFDAICRVTVSPIPDPKLTHYVAVASHDIPTLRAGLDVAMALPIVGAQQPINHRTLGMVIPLTLQSGVGDTVQLFDKGGALYLETDGVTKFLTIVSSRFGSTGDIQELKKVDRFYGLLSQTKLVRTGTSAEVTFPAIDEIPDSPLLRDVTISFRSNGVETSEGAAPTHLVTWMSAPPAPTASPVAYDRPGTAASRPVSSNSGSAPSGSIATSNGAAARTVGSNAGLITASQSNPSESGAEMGPLPAPSEPTATPFPPQESCFAAPIPEPVFPLVFEPLQASDNALVGLTLPLNYVTEIAPNLMPSERLAAIRAAFARKTGSVDDVFPVFLLHGTPVLKASELREGDHIATLWLDRKGFSLTEPIVVDPTIVITGLEGDTYKLDCEGTPLLGVSSFNVISNNGASDLAQSPFSVSELAAALGFRNYVLREPGVCTWAILLQQASRMFNYTSSAEGEYVPSRIPCRAGTNPITGLCLDDGPAPAECTADNRECECRALRKSLEDAWKLDRDPSGNVADASFISAFVLQSTPARKRLCDPVLNNWCEERQRFEERCIQNSDAPQSPNPIKEESCTVTTLHEKPNVIHNCFDADEGEEGSGKAGRYCIDNTNSWWEAKWEWIGDPNNIEPSIRYDTSKGPDRDDAKRIRSGKYKFVGNTRIPSDWERIKDRYCAPVYNNDTCVVELPMRLPKEVGRKDDVERSWRAEGVPNLISNLIGFPQNGVGGNAPQIPLMPKEKEDYLPERGDVISKCFDAGPENKEISPKDNEIGFHAECLPDNDWDSIKNRVCKPIFCEPRHPETAALFGGSPWGEALATSGKLYKEVPCTVELRPPLRDAGQDQKALCSLPDEVFNLACHPRYCVQAWPLLERRLKSFTMDSYGGGQFAIEEVINYEKVCRGPTNCTAAQPTPVRGTPSPTLSPPSVGTPNSGQRKGKQAPASQPDKTQTCVPDVPSPEIETREGSGGSAQAVPRIAAPTPKSVNPSEAKLVEANPPADSKPSVPTISAQAMVGLASGNLGALGAWLAVGLSWLKEVSAQNYKIFEIDPALVQDVPSDVLIATANVEREIREWINEQRSKNRSEAEIEPELQERLTKWLNSDLMQQHPQIRHFYLTAYHLYNFDVFQQELETKPELKEALDNFTTESTKQLDEATKPGGSVSLPLLLNRYATLLGVVEASDLPSDMKQRLREEFSRQLKEVEDQIAIFQRGDAAEIKALTERNIARLRESSDTWRSITEGVLGLIETARVLDKHPEIGRTLDRLEELKAQRYQVQDELVRMAKEENPLNLIGVDLNGGGRSRLEAKQRELRELDQQHSENLRQLYTLIEQAGIAPEVLYLLLGAYSAQIKSEGAITNYAMDGVINSLREVEAQGEIVCDVAIAVFLTAATGGLSTAITAVRTVAIGARVANFGRKAMVGLEVASSAKAVRMGAGMVRLGVTGAAYGAAGDFAYQPLAASLNAYRLSKYNKTSFFSELATEQERLSQDRGERLKVAMGFGAMFGVLGGFSGLLSSGSTIGKATDIATKAGMAGVVGYGLGSQIWATRALSNEMQAAVARGDNAEATRLYQEIIRGQGEIAANLAFMFPAYKLWQGASSKGIPARSVGQQAVLGTPVGPKSVQRFQAIESRLGFKLTDGQKIRLMKEVGLPKEGSTRLTGQAWIDANRTARSILGPKAEALFREGLIGGRRFTNEHLSSAQFRRHSFTDPTTGKEHTSPDSTHLLKSGVLHDSSRRQWDAFLFNPQNPTRPEGKTAKSFVSLDEMFAPKRTSEVTVSEHVGDNTGSSYRTSMLSGFNPKIWTAHEGWGGFVSEFNFKGFLNDYRAGLLGDVKFAILDYDYCIRYHEGNLRGFLMERLNSSAEIDTFVAEIRRLGEIERRLGTSDKNQVKEPFDILLNSMSTKLRLSADKRKALDTLASGLRHGIGMDEFLIEFPDGYSHAYTSWSQIWRDWRITGDMLSSDAVILGGWFEKPLTVGEIKVMVQQQPPPPRSWVELHP